MTAKKPKPIKLKFGTRTDRYGDNATLPKAPWEEDKAKTDKADGDSDE